MFCSRNVFCSAQNRCIEDHMPYVAHWQVEGLSIVMIWMLFCDAYLLGHTLEGQCSVAHGKLMLYVDYPGMV